MNNTQTENEILSQIHSIEIQRNNVVTELLNLKNDLNDMENIRLCVKDLLERNKQPTITFLTQLLQQAQNYGV